MTTEELKIKVSLETQRLKQELRTLKQAFKDIKLDSKNKKESNELVKSLEKVEKTLKDIDKIDIGDNLTEGLDKAKRKAKEVNNAVKDIGKGKTNISIDGAGDLEEQFGAIRDSLESIQNLSFLDLIANLGGNLKFLRTGGLEAAEGFSTFGDSIGNALAHLVPWSKLSKDTGTWGIGAAFAQLKAGAGELSMKLGSMASNFKGFLASIPAGVAAAVAALATILAIVVAITAAVKNAINMAKQATELAHAAEKIGMTTQAYGEWGYVITQLGGELKDLTDYIKTLSAAQNEVRAGSEDVIAAFARLGMSAEEIGNMSQSEMFARTIEGLQNIENEVERVSLAYKIFGEDDAAKITTLLNTNNAEIQQMIHNYHVLGGVMSGGLVHNSKVLTGALANLRVAWTGLKNTLAEVFLPIIIPVVQWLVKAVAVVNMFIRAIFGKEIVTASSGITNVASAYTGYTDSANRATNATNKVTEAVERLKRVTMGFDELNKLSNMSTPSSSGSDGGDAGSVGQLPSGGGIGGLDIPTTEELGLDGIAAWFEKYQTQIADWTAILLTLGGIALAVFCFLGGNIAGGIAGLALAGIGIAVGSQEDGVWDRMVDSMKEVWENVKTWFNQKVKPVFTKEFWTEKWDSVKEGADKVWEKIKNSAFVKFFTETLKDKAVNFVAEFKEKGKEIREKITAAWDKIKSKTAELKGEFKEAGTKIKTKLTDAWKSLKSKTATLTGKFKESGSSTRKKLANAWKDFKTKTSTLTVKFKDAFTAKIKSAWNGLVKAINKAIGTINKIPGVNIPKLPYLAKGGITTGPTTAVIGEAGREAVLPLENNTGWMDTLADKIAARNGGGGPTKVILTVDGKQLGWATIDNINSITKQTGVLPLQLA